MQRESQVLERLNGTAYMALGSVSREAQGTALWRYTWVDVTSRSKQHFSVTRVNHQGDCACSLSRHPHHERVLRNSVPMALDF